MNGALPRERRRPILQEAAANVLAADTVESLQQLTDGGYSYRVTTSVAHTFNEQWALYLHPVLIRRTHAVLLRKRAAELRSEEGRRGHNSSDNKRRNRVRKFLDLLEERIDQVETELGGTVFEEQRRTIRLLEQAIESHREALADNDVIPEAWDEQLWRALDRLSPTPAEPTDRTA
jgi:hypothetical protein